MILLLSLKGIKFQDICHGFVMAYAMGWQREMCGA
jgi:hypothetical protein